MTKIELIHNTMILALLKSLMKTNELYGFTCLNVHEGYGPLKGEYKQDHIGDQQYYTVILMQEESKANELVEILKKRAPTNKFICLKSQVEYMRA